MKRYEDLEKIFGNWKTNLHKWIKQQSSQFLNIKCKHEYENIYCIDTGEYMYKQCKWCNKKKYTWIDN